MLDSFLTPFKPVSSLRHSLLVFALMHSSSWLRCRKKFERLITLITHFTVLRISVKSLITKPRKEKLVGIESTLAWGRYKAFYSHIFNTRNPDDPPIFIKFAGFSVVELVITFQQCIADFLCLCSFIFSVKTPFLILCIILTRALTTCEKMLSLFLYPKLPIGFSLKIAVHF